MIVTLTANPSLDRTVDLDGELTPGGVHRIQADKTQPGGKGINVAFGVHRAGLDVLAVFPAPEADPLLGLLDADQLPYRAVPSPGKVRTNITVVSDPDVTTKINEPGTPLSADDVAAVESTLADAVGEGDTVMLSGSLAPGFPADEYATLIRQLRAKGAWVGVDTSDAPLAALFAAGPDSAPDFLKPNAEELGQLTGRDGVELEALVAQGDMAAVTEAARHLHEQGVAEVLVTLGGSGAVLVTAEGAWYSPSPKVSVASTVGAGDSATAGYLIGRVTGAAPAERLALSIAYGAVAVSLPGTTIPARSQVSPNPGAVITLQ
ncbi:1-phosphofructokinase family hexose kinase [Tessaracoccus caeni]|uniref:1-phosphofructokinase family hexose kinase n=1 Tax=Tessaracoccus caeni TaxID=3031239 RepID=UPI0023DBACEA|nr:1-phosphofructokinase family hexose kinase [Tessaracoccus caeni]MDF1486795.1 1-phosphofructokinase family hexose kinase [Tessaracoccus caeni]